MDSATLFSDILVWSIGALTLVGGALVVMAVWSMGRASYRKD